MTNIRDLEYKSLPSLFFAYKDHFKFEGVENEKVLNENFSIYCTSYNDKH